MATKPQSSPTATAEQPQRDFPLPKTGPTGLREEHKRLLLHKLATDPKWKE